MFFIVSTGRSGTVTISELLSQINNVTCLHEPEPAFILEASGYRYGSVSPQEIKKILLDTRKPVLNGKIYCESNQNLSLIVPELVEVFPSARYIWLIRNGLDVVASTMQKGWYSGLAENDVPYEDATSLQKQWIDGRIEGDKCKDVSEPAWNQMSRFEKCCWYWSYINRTIKHDLENRNLPYYTLYLEGLETQLPFLLEWMDIQITELPNIPRVNQAQQIPYHWKKWSKREREVFTHWCGGIMDVHYPNWKSKNGQWLDIKYETPPQRIYTGFIIQHLKKHLRWLKKYVPKK